MFQDTMKQFVSGCEDPHTIEYRSGPIKTKQRCIQVCRQKWRSTLFPSAAHILDFVRGTVVCNNPKDMLDSVDHFVKFVSDKSRTHCIVSIIQCNNDFNQFMSQDRNLQLNTKAAYKYCDITFNIVIYDIYSNQAIIGEVKFTLNWMLDAKQTGDKFKLIETQMNYISNSNLYLRDVQGRDFERKSRVINIIGGTDYESLVEYMLYFENRFLSLLNIDGTLPLLYECVKNRFYQGFHFFRQCIKHFSQLLGPLINGKTSVISDFETEYFLCNINKTINAKLGVLVTFFLLLLLYL